MGGYPLFHRNIVAQHVFCDRKTTQQLRLVAVVRVPPSEAIEDVEAFLATGLGEFAFTKAKPNLGQFEGDDN